MAWGQARGRRVGHGNKEPRGRGCGMGTRGIKAGGPGDKRPVFVVTISS